MGLLLVLFLGFLVSSFFKRKHLKTEDHS
jgi:hypothetical protein